MADCDIGIYGLAVMGQNFALNIADHGFKVAVYNRTKSKITDFMAEEAADKPIEAAYELQDFVNLIRKPRVIVLIVKAGPATDAIIDNLIPYLEEGDIIIDSGNSYYKDTERRAAMLTEKGFNFLGMGISGGEEGARHGPSLMPGGPSEVYARVQPMLEAVAAKAEGEPCVTYLGPGSAGHYVKMVHNGIEYGIMQAIAEVYDVLSRGAGMGAGQIGDIFQRWSKGLLSSFLVDITGNILVYTAPEDDKPLVDIITDSAQQKGTGKWTTQDALDLGVSVPTISAAIEARIISALKSERVKAATILQGPTPSFDGDQAQLVDALEQALLATEICAYAQGFAALHSASEEYNYHLNMADIARIWRNGCIIRATLLNDMSRAFTADNALSNLMIAPYFAELLAKAQSGWRESLKIAVGMGIPTPALSSALAYYDSYRSGRLPANLIQAQRDFFGAHTYERLDNTEGTAFHTIWQEI
ncbi:NADP-dependent phosphogluconate dehydrogenase [Phototrophicus methaneseepsis]|uniref:6-phosphogluconate dehydrogenase, decarboxylating n=1 Tax=Phototrophicus methaneseepsis TaxID=2710758 RepID=A0A7S8ID89_9CHLR|nr:NADP-dependent phosphogluconate dehydrogenase [Phototrophicus methaneseepsis]QPC81286.1 NADP-dependent phosphogluconate dehydrogenase [Phototrophicus methaneseepsis]